MDKQQIDEIVGYLIDIKSFDNFVAKLSIIYSFIELDNMSIFHEKHIFSMRSEIDSKKQLINETYLNKIYGVLDYIENFYIAQKISR